ncbi:Poly(ADP-ribose) polymerase, catalytic domain [Phytophthora cactorum]|nr:Poly(ADP-ribose) polymerase, catalytic domain [Phytophthora cactorum]
MLNLTDISYGTYGNNKFYLGQLIVDRGGFVVFRKWGRVGAKTPQSKTEFFSSVEPAEGAFQKVFQSKSGNKWPLTEPFVRKKGKYFLVELDDGEPEGPSVDTEAKVEENMFGSKLPQEVQNIVQLICDPEVVTREMASLNGYEILQRLSAALEEIEQLTKAATAAKRTKAGAKSRRKAKAKAKGPAAATTKSLAALQADLKSLSSEFYSLIPHDFGRSLPPVIGTMADLKLKLELLEVLSNLEISQMLQKQAAEKPSGPAIHPLDTHYNMLNTNMEPLKARGKEYKIIEKFIQNTHGGSKLNINTILKIARPDEETHKDVLGSLDNHMLLWHGSRLSNFVGILSQGLRIAPPEAPTNGYQFGKGLYFADALAKSANYCCATSRNATAVLLLADVALGTPFKTPSGEFLDYKTVKGQRGCDSTHGLGRMAPAKNEFETLSDGVVVPAGTLKPVDGNQYLLYNEFIVYRREQVQLRYLVALDFQNVAAAKRVDPLSGCPSSAEVYQDGNDVAWSFMLNYTNISFGTYGNNKFYMVQLIQNGNNYMVFRKWGRVGAKNPQRALEHYNTSLEKAQASLTKKFLDKSGNEWPLLDQLDDEVPEEEEEMSDVEKEEEVLSTLHETVQDVLKLICDADLIAREVANMNLDLKRLPLGKLSKAQISQGYALLQQLSEALKEIEELNKVIAALRRNLPQNGLTTPIHSGQTSSQAECCPNPPPKDQSENPIKRLLHPDSARLWPKLTAPDRFIGRGEAKDRLARSLANIEISQKLQAEKKRNAKKNAGAKLNSLDAQYNMLNVKMEPLPESTEDSNYRKTTHAPTHVQYKLRIKSVLKIARPDEEEFKDVFQSVDNHKLLWHGSRLSNVIGILSKGLRVAPPEAPNNGYMFGKGIYFADSVSKSANYCWTTPQNPKGVLILAEVALGTPYKVQEAEDLTYATLKKTKGCDSTHGVGRMAAPEEDYETIEDGVVVPVGEFVPSDGSGSLLYNEFIVYRQEQVKLRYLVNLDFLYEDEEEEA